MPAIGHKTISSSRRTAKAIVNGIDPLNRLLVIVGPCSIHDVDQAKEYASRLRKGVQEGKWPGLEVVMRVYLYVSAARPSFHELQAETVNSVRSQGRLSAGRV